MVALKYEIQRLAKETPLPIINKTVDEDYVPPDGNMNTTTDDNFIETNDNENFYDTKIYKDYVKLKLLIKGNIADKKL